LLVHVINYNQNIYSITIKQLNVLCKAGQCISLSSIARNKNSPILLPPYADISTFDTIEVRMFTFYTSIFTIKRIHLFCAFWAKWISKHNSRQNWLWEPFDWFALGSHLCSSLANALLPFFFSLWWIWTHSIVQPIKLKETPHTLPLSQFFNTVDKKGYARCTLPEWDYANKGYRVLLTHGRTDVHRQKMYNVIMCSVAQILFVLTWQ
jgi:hypothetical protein